MALLALQSNANQMLSFRIRNDEYLPSIALPVFRSPEHAMEFRDSVLMFADTRSFVWTVSLCRRTNEATFETRVRPNKLKRLSVRPKVFDVNDEWFVDELITREIGCVVVDDYNLIDNRLVVDGSIWIPTIKAPES